MQVKKIYDIILDNEKIGTTELEKADAPMGVVFGKVISNKTSIDYDFLKTYCLNNGIKIITDIPEDYLIVTANIPNLKVVSNEEIEIRSECINFEGMDFDGMDIVIIGIHYTFFEEEFPQHLNEYNNQLMINK